MRHGELENPPPFEPSGKRRRGIPSETKVRRGLRVVHGDKELAEKLGRNDLCPCGSKALSRAAACARAASTVASGTTTRAR